MAWVALCVNVRREEYSFVRRMEVIVFGSLWTCWVSHNLTTQTRSGPMALVTSTSVRAVAMTLQNCFLNSLPIGRPRIRYGSYIPTAPAGGIPPSNLLRNSRWRCSEDYPAECRPRGGVGLKHLDNLIWIPTRSVMQAESRKVERIQRTRRIINNFSFPRSTCIFNYLEPHRSFSKIASIHRRCRFNHPKPNMLINLK